MANAHTLLNGGGHPHSDASYSNSPVLHAHYLPSSPPPPSASPLPSFYPPHHSHLSPPLLYPYPSPPPLSYPPDVSYYHPPPPTSFPSPPPSFAPPLPSFFPSPSPLTYDPPPQPHSPPRTIKVEGDAERGAEGAEHREGGSGSSKKRRLEATDDGWAEGEGGGAGDAGEGGAGDEGGEEGEDGEEAEEEVEAEADADADASSLSSLSSAPPSPSLKPPSKVEIPPAMNRSIIECFAPSTQLLVLPRDSPPLFLSLDDLLHQQRVSPYPLLVGSYNEGSGTLEYHPSATPVFVKEGEHRMVDVDERTGKEGGGRVVLSVTRDHSVYARFGAAEGDWEERGWHRTEATAMLGGEGRAVVQFRGNASAGVAGLQPLVDPHSLLPCADALELRTEDEMLAFCELYGAFLANGALLDEERSLAIAARDDEAAEYLSSVLTRLLRVLPSWQTRGCAMGAADHEDEPRSSEFVIRHPRWWALFAEHYKHTHCRPPQRETAEKSQLSIQPSSPSPAVSSSSSCTSVTRNLPSSPSSSHESFTDDDALSPHEDVVDLPCRPAPSLFPWVLLSLNRDYLRHILRGYRQSPSGCDSSLGSVYTTSTSFRDELLLLCLHAGYSVHFEREQSTWAVRYTDSDAAQPILHCRRDVSERSFTGRVFCVTVPPHHLVIVRTVLARDADGTVIDASRPIVVGQCGIIDPVTSTRQLSHHSPYFNKTVEVYTAVSDPERRTLYRASALAEKFSCATNKVGMYLARRRHCETGLWQSVGFRHKPSGRTGLKAGGYFLSQEICESFQFHFQKQVGRRREKKGADGDKLGDSEKQGKKRGRRDSERVDREKGVAHADSAANDHAHDNGGLMQNGDGVQQLLPPQRDEETGARRMDEEVAPPSRVKREPGSDDEHQQHPQHEQPALGAQQLRELRSASPASDDGLQNAHTILASTSPAPGLSPRSYSGEAHDAAAYHAHSPHSHAHALPLPHPLPHLHTNGIHPSAHLPTPHPHGQDQHLLYSGAVPLGPPGVNAGGGDAGGSDAVEERGRVKLEAHPGYYGDPGHAVAAMVMDVRGAGEQMDAAQLLSPHHPHPPHPHSIAPLPAHTLQHAQPSLDVSMEPSQALLHHPHDPPPHFHTHQPQLQQHIDHSVEHAPLPAHYPSHPSHSPQDQHGLSHSQHAQHLDVAAAHQLLHTVHMGMGGHGGGLQAMPHSATVVGGQEYGGGDRMGMGGMVEMYGTMDGGGGVNVVGSLDGRRVGEPSHLNG